MTNYAGSLLCMVLLFPGQYGIVLQSLASVLFEESIVHERLLVLGYWGSENQHSGTGQDNYRTNIIEFLIGYLATHPNDLGAVEACNCLQRAWAEYRHWVDEHNGNWRLTKSECLRIMLKESGRVPVPGFLPTGTTQTHSQLSALYLREFDLIVPCDFAFRPEAKFLNMFEWYSKIWADFEEGGYWNLANVFKENAKIYNFVMMVFKHWDSLDTTMPETPEAVLEIPKDVCGRWCRQLASPPKLALDTMD